VRANAAVWTALAAIVVAIVGPFVAFILIELSRAPDTGSAADVFRDWQGILGGLLALVGAAAAASVVVWQIEETRNLEEERRTRRAQALWATMPHEFSRSSEYIDACKQILTHTFNNRNTNGAQSLSLAGMFRTSPLIAPEIPSGFVDNLRHLIEHCQASEVHILTNYAIWIQIQNARLRLLVDGLNGHPGQIVLVQNLVSASVDLGEIKLFNDILFGYARSSKRRALPDIDAESVRSSVARLGFDGAHIHPDLERSFDSIVRHRSSNIYCRKQSVFDQYLL
jgi:hypothetical protein